MSYNDGAYAVVFIYGFKAQIIMRNEKLYKEYCDRIDSGLMLQLTYEEWLERRVLKLTKLVNKNAVLRSVSNCKADTKLNKIEEELGILQDIHGNIEKEYETYNKNSQAFRFKDGAVYRIRLDRATGKATLD